MHAAFSAAEMGGWQAKGVQGVTRPLAGELASVTHVSIMGERKAVQKCQVPHKLHFSPW